MTGVQTCALPISDFFLPLFLLQFFLPFLTAVQIEEGLLEDAESQIELLSVMHNAEELSPEFLFLKSQIVRLSNKRDLKSKRDINHYFHFYFTNYDLLITFTFLSLIAMCSLDLIILLEYAILHFYSCNFNLSLSLSLYLTHSLSRAHALSLFFSLSMSLFLSFSHTHTLP